MGMFEMVKNFCMSSRAAVVPARRADAMAAAGLKLNVVEGGCGAGASGGRDGRGGLETQYVGRARFAAKKPMRDLAAWA